MSSTILSTSQSTFENIPIERKVDVLKPVPSMAPSQPIARRKISIPAQGSVAFDSEVRFEMPRHQYLSDFAVEWGATFSAGEQATSYAGLVFPKRIRWELGGQRIMEVDYPELMAALMTKMSGQRVTDLLTLSGGSGTADKETGEMLPECA